QAPERSLLRGIERIREGGPEEQRPEGERDLGEPGQEGRVERLEAREQRGGEQGDGRRRAAAPQPSRRDAKRRDLEEREEERHRMVVPPVRQKRDSRVEEREPERILRMGKAGEPRLPLRHPTREKDRL